MLVLHGLWIGKEFIVWGEADAEPVRRGRPPRHPGGKPHPFQCTIRDLRSLLDRMYPGQRWGVEEKERKLWLNIPSDKYVPQGSPGLLMERGNDDYVMAPWEITGLALSPHIFIETIVANFSNELIQDLRGVTLAEDWLFWMLYGRFVLRLLCRQKFIPGLTLGRDEQVVASWQPVLEDPEDRKILKELGRTVPPVCKSVKMGPSEEPHYGHGQEMLMSALKGIMEELIPFWLVEMKQTEDNAPVERKWIYALHNQSNHVNGTKREIKGLVDGFKQWTTPLREERRSFRTCFRLEPPANSEEDWYLSFYLQATDDPDLLVGAKEIWQRNQSMVILRSRRLQNPQEKLLKDLGKALRLFPPIERGLTAARPEGCSLQEEEAYRFLRETSILLQESGFGVILPTWWKERRKRRLGLALELKSVDAADKISEVKVMGLQTLVEYDWKLSLGGQIIDYEELKKLAAQKRPLVQMGGQWVELDTKEMKGVLRWLDEKKESGTIPLGEALQLSGGTMKYPVIQSIHADGWIKSLLQGLDGEAGFVLLDTPSSFCGRLRPYQQRGFSWLAFLKERGLGACLADDMGLGKTIQVIALLAYGKERRDERGTVLLVCPTSLVGNWYREILRFSPHLKVLIHHGTERLSGREFLDSAGRYDIVISTYNLVYRDIDTLGSCAWHGTVLDEAQNIKNPQAKQSKAVKRLNTGYRIALTGTPLENRLQEIWSIMDFLNPGFLGTREAFRRKFAIPIEKYGDGERAASLRALTQPFILRRVKSDPEIIRDLPEKQEMKVYCTLTREQASLYEAVVEEIIQKIASLEGIKRKGLILSSLTKLKQICDHPALFLHEEISSSERSGKLDRLAAMLEEVLAAGDKALIFTQYAQMGSILQRELKHHFQREVLFLHGSISSKIRDEMVNRFQAKEGPSIFILSLRAGGVGLNLTQANHVFHYDRWWNPAVENQATDRAFRIGQLKNVQVHKYICTGTLEEKIDALIERKKALTEQIVGTGESWLTELSNEDLRNLISLDRSMLVDE